MGPIDPRFAQDPAALSQLFEQLVGGGAPLQGAPTPAAPALPQAAPIAPPPPAPTPAGGGLGPTPVEPPEGLPMGDIPTARTVGAPQASTSSSGQRSEIEGAGALLSSLMGEGGGLDQSAADQERALRNQMGAAGAYRASEAEAMDRAAEERRRIAGDREARAKNQRAELEAAAGEIGKISDEISALRYEEKPFWAGRSTGAKIAAALAVVAGGFAAGRAGQENLALNNIRRMVAEDVERQRFAWQAKRLGLKDAKDAREGVYSRLMDRFGKEDAAAAATEALGLEAVLAQGEALKARARGAVDVAALDQQLAGIRGELMSRRVAALTALAPRVTAGETRTLADGADQTTYVTPEALAIQGAARAEERSLKLAEARIKAGEESRKVEREEGKELTKRTVRLGGQTFTADTEKRADEATGIVQGMESIKPAIQRLRSHSRGLVLQPSEVDQMHRDANIIVGRLNQMMAFGSMDNSTLELLKDMVTRELPDKGAWTPELKLTDRLQDTMADVERMLINEVNAGLGPLIGAKLDDQWRVAAAGSDTPAAEPDAPRAANNSR